MQTRLSQHDIRRLAVAARRDPRTVIAALAGLGKPDVRAQIVSVARELEISLPLPEAQVA